MTDPLSALGAPSTRATPAAAPRAEPNPSTRAGAQDFPALLVGQLVREMFNTVSAESENGPFGDGPGADVYKSLAETALSESLAKRGLDALTDRVHEAITPRGERK